LSAILSWGLDLVRGVQSLATPPLTFAMKAFSFMGTEFFFFLLLPLIYWCVDRRRGMRMSVLVLAATAVNIRLKLLFAEPRPYDLDPSVAMARESTYGLPSNHAMTSAIVGGSVAALLRRSWRPALAIGFPLLVGLSRVYLGVHFPTDVLAGWALGAVFVLVDALYGERILRAVAAQRESVALAAVAALAIGMNFLTGNETALSGSLFGFAGAAIYARKSAPFSASAGSFGRKCLRYLVGMAAVVAAYGIPKLALAGLEAGGPPLVRFLRYALVGATASGLAPRLFLKLGLAEREDYSAKENEGSVSLK